MSVKRPPKEKKPTVDELLIENRNLGNELEAVRLKKQTMNTKWTRIGNVLLEAVHDEWKYKNKIGNDPHSISGEKWMSVLDQLVVKHPVYEVPVEGYVEQLEKVVTDSCLDLAQTTEKCRTYEQGLDMLLLSDEPDELKDKVFALKLKGAEAYYSFLANDRSRVSDELFKIPGVTNRAGDDARRVIDDANKLDLHPPSVRCSSDIPLKNMASNLLLYIVKELSVEKTSGADWRTLAQRLGLSQELIKDWCSKELTYPASLVLHGWMKACGTNATIRQLYAHLMSPQMRCTVLCKRIADFYDVC